MEGLGLTLVLSCEKNDTDKQRHEDGAELPPHGELRNGAARVKDELFESDEKQRKEREKDDNCGLVAKSANEWVGQ